MPTPGFCSRPWPPPFDTTRRASGFTLIELLVVLLILAAMIGMIGIGLTRGDRDRVREEADRLAVLLEAARQEAILQGQVFAWQLTEHGYHFLHLDDRGRLAPLERDDLLSPRRLPDNMAISLASDGATPEDGAGIVIEPTGLFPPFVVTLAAGGAVWRVEGLANGVVRAAAPGRSHAT